MTARARRYAAGAVAGLALTAGLTGCRTDAGQSSKVPGGDGKATSGVRLTAAQQALSAASDKTSDVKSFRATMSTTTTVAGRRMRMNGDLAVRAKPTPAMTFNVPTIDVAGRSTPGFRELMTGDMIYLRMPAIARLTGKPWVGFSFAQLSKATGIDLQSMENQSRQADPSLNAKMLTASKDVHIVGKETVGGVPTTHYQGSYSLQEALAKLGTAQRAQMQKAFGRAGFDKFDFNLWIDSQQLPRKLTLATPPGSKLTMNMTMNYLGYNVPVTVKAPPKSQVADGAKLKGAGGNNVPG